MHQLQLPIRVSHSSIELDARLTRTMAKFHSGRLDKVDEVAKEGTFTGPRLLLAHEFQIASEDIGDGIGHLDQGTIGRT